MSFLCQKLFRHSDHLRPVLDKGEAAPANQMHLGRSPDRVRWTPTGVNVPDYPKLAQIWWQQIGDVNSGAFTPQEAMDRLASEGMRFTDAYAACPACSPTTCNPG